MGYFYNETEDSLAHHGVKGQKWGVRRFQNSDGTLTAAGKKRKEKIIESENPRKILKNRKLLNQQEYEEAYKRAKMKRDLQEWSKPSEAAVRRRNAIIKAGLAVGSVYFLTKTETGKNLCNKGKEKVSGMIKDFGKQKINSVEEAAKSTVKKAADSVKETARETRKQASASMYRAMKNNNPAATGLYKYGKAIDKLIGR